VLRGDERRVVTVLFADLVGFTTMAERRDPEQVKNLVDRCFERLAADVAAFGGRVDKVMGDAILALFGAPIAHEDDAERAVRAALQMQQTFTRWLEDTGAEGLQLRVGVNTGEVLIGGLRAGGDWTAMGDTVNTANRLQSMALPGTVVVGPDTHAATTAAVRFTPLGALEARGRAELVEAWVAEETVAPPGRRLRRADVALVGRDHERVTLDGLVDGAVRRRRATTVVVVGEAGVGKTRLVEEVAARAEREHGALVFEGACVPYGEANVWWPIADALRSAMATPVGTPPRETRDRCKEWVGQAQAGVAVDEIDRVTEGLLHLLGEPSSLEGIDPTRAREEVTRSLVAHVEGWASQRPVVVAISDLHWADDAVLALGAALTERSAHLPFVFLGTARENLLERWRPSVERANQVVLHLDPLDRESAGDLLDQLACEIDEDLRRIVLDRSGGNPFFLEELARLLGDGGGGTGVPHTLRGLVAARLDGLAAAEREVIDSGAILGRRFPKMAVQLMVEKTGTASPAQVERALSELLAKDLLACEDGEFYMFRSDLVREVAYDTLTKAARVKGHFGVADWIERHPTGSVGDRDRVAHHYATAASLVAEVGAVDGLPTDLADRALAALGEALDSAAAVEAYVAVRRYATQALLLSTPALDGPTRVRFLLARAKAAGGLRALEDAEVDLADARFIAEASGDPVLVADVCAVRGLIEQKRGDIAESIALLEGAVETFRSIGDQRRIGDALLGLGTSHIFAGDAVEAEDAFGEALDAFRTLGDLRGEAWAVQNLAWVAFSAGRIDAADAHGSASLAIFEDLGDRGGVAWALGLQAYIRFHQGRFTEAEVLADRVLDEAEGRDDPWAIGMMLALRGSLRLWTGRSAAALAPAEQARERFAAMGDWYGQLLALGVLGRSLVSQGRIEEGFAVIDEGVAVAGTTTSSAAPVIATVHLVTSAAQAGRPDRVVGVDLGFTVDDLEEPEIGFTDCLVADGLLHLQRGEVAEARDQLERLAVVLADETPSAALAALAMVRAAAGDVAGAMAAADEVRTLPLTTYADLSAAATAKALAAARTGDGHLADAQLAFVRETLESTDERLGRSLLALASATADRALGRPVAPGAGTEAAATCPGWATAYRLVAGLGETDQIGQDDGSFT
jgi:class 3 adenylate cyclase/tetratricopeptide (TPR) repeat protein